MTEPSDRGAHLDNARAHIDAGVIVATGARFALLKRLVLRLAHGITAEQAEFNRSAFAVIEGMASDLEAVQGELAATNRRLLKLQATLAADGVAQELAGAAPGDAAAVLPVTPAPGP